MLVNSFLLTGIIFGVSLTAFADQDPHKAEEWQLMDFLFTNYSKSQRPSPIVNISLNLAVSNLDGVDTKKEQIGLNIWFQMFWMDHRLQWNLSQYNVTSLTVNFEHIWTPDMVLYSAVGTVRDFGISSEDDLQLSVIIYNSGAVFFSQPTNIQSACAMNISDFPFDDQVCHVTFGSWTMDLTLLRLDLRNDGIDLKHFIQNNMWYLLSISPEMKNQEYFSHENPFSTVVYTIAIRRKSLFYVVNYITPPVAISLLSLSLFLIPPEVGKRMEAGINLLLCLSVYLLLVNSKMPSTSTAFPLLTKFYGCAIIILVLAMCCTCLVYALYFMNSSGLELHDASMALRLKNFILRWLKPLLFSCPCKRSDAKPRRNKSTVHPNETDYNLDEFNNEEQDKRTEDKQSDDEQQGAISSQDPPVIITSTSLPRNSVVSPEDQEGKRTMTKTVSFEHSSSISSIAELSFKAPEGPREDNLLTTVYYSLSAENNLNAGVTDEGKKVTFAPLENGQINAVKRRWSFRKSSESAVNQTEHTLVSSAGSSWFSQSSWDEPQGNENEGYDKRREDISGHLDEEIDQSRGLESEASRNDSNTDEQASLELFDQLVLSFEIQNTKSGNTVQWQKAAMVLDRIFIILLFTSIVVSFVTCLLLAPRVRNSLIP